MGSPTPTASVKRSYEKQLRDEREFEEIIRLRTMMDDVTGMSWEINISCVGLDDWALGSNLDEMVEKSYYLSIRVKHRQYKKIIARDPPGLPLYRDLLKTLTERIGPVAKRMFTGESNLCGTNLIFIPSPENVELLETLYAEKQLKT
jgi:hypothetical protein